MTFRARDGALAVIIASAALVLTGCTPSGPPVSDISSAIYSQSQAVPDFDGAEYTQDDPTQLQRLIDLFDEYDVDPVTYDSAKEDCPGGLTTDVTLTYSDSDLARQFSLGGCGDDDFDDAATDLFSEWHDDASDVTG